MSKILITGNGFDLFHHLPTKYGHFISILNTIENFGCDGGFTFETLFGHCFKNNFETDLRSIVDNYNVELLKFEANKIHEMKTLISENLWYQHFKNILDIESWIDFEVEIYKFLDEISDFSIDIGSDFAFEKVHLGFDKYDFEKVINLLDKNGELRKEFVDRKGKFSVNLFIKIFVKDLIGFIEIFNNYFYYIIEPFYNHCKSKHQLSIHLIDHIYIFNYTSTAQLFYNMPLDKITYLHGKYNKESVLHNMIIGVKDVPELFKSNKIFDFAKYFQKIRNNANEKFVESTDIFKKNLSETIFYVIGHSLDKSDENYVKDLFNYLELDKNKFSKICVFYYDKKDYDSKLNNLFQIIDEEIISKMNKNKRLYFIELNNKNLNYEFNRILKNPTNYNLY